MATTAQNVATAIANYSAILADISANPKPSYSVDGESYSWVEYQNFLIDKLESLQKLQQQFAGPQSVRTRGRF